jgi:ABC-type uncharacterized transport system permease subunit
VQRYNAITNNGKTNVGGTTISKTNADGFGNFVATTVATGAEIAGTQWGWNTALFGTRPQQYFLNSLGTALTAPPAPGTYANNFVIP